MVLTVLTLISVHATPTVLSQVRSSSNFQIERDSINSAGGFSTSSSFQLEATAGEDGAGTATSSNFALQAGFQQQDQVTLTLTGGQAVIMDGDLGGITGGESNGSTTVVASTDGAAGYALTIESNSNPTLQSGASSIAEYAPVGGTADNTFITTSSDAHVGFSPFGTDVVARYLTSGSVCGSGSASTTACWDGLSMTPVVISSAPGANAPAGATTTVYFKVGIGSGVTQPPGVYVGTTTITLQSL